VNGPIGLEWQLGCDAQDAVRGQAEVVSGVLAAGDQA
jgi:hypothetical protein